jgi:hypothetical protein
MIALALTAITVLSLVTLMIGGLRLLEKSQETAEATGVGRELMEAIKARKYARLPANASFDGRVPDAAQADGFPPAPYPAVQRTHLYRTRVQVQPLSPQLRLITVQVFWKTQSTLQLTTILTS